ncbi:hypothetical protein PF005_g11555 [Phytophthora fragariae]|uniref:Uncharacterized protein n=2 Tax=Phytophthora TaxID=4783 RepID=A0A6A3LMH7_9STRA|nr:hypothetical protein PF009_g12715 [Phytophthora fragariae]KAE9342845.1 hypothetical protein PR003_g9267 [Phytophthora rubi]KAE9019217.1 hypothetical protein PF011_g5927 [Phytophthora fragariae]KAE9144368.1 hypothetical protein PF006_g10685 [Phytophthora fragariae]KAE9210135.1 hypothetical protein PF005_g11555 [Phytophthora fragariae]
MLPSSNELIGEDQRQQKMPQHEVASSSEPEPDELPQPWKK